MSTMFRYHRPLEFHGVMRGKLSTPYFSEMRTGLYGGICFRLHADARDLSLKQQYVSYSICHPKELFNKDVARRIAEERAAHGAGFWIPSEATTPDSILYALSRRRLSSAADPQNDWIQLYKELDLDLLCTRYEEIEERNVRLLAEQRIQHEVLNAMNLKAKYASQNR